jgi:hypothetical protein
MGDDLISQISDLKKESSYFVCGQSYLTAEDAEERRGNLGSGGKTVPAKTANVTPQSS